MQTDWHGLGMQQTGSEVDRRRLHKWQMGWGFVSVMFSCVFNRGLDTHGSGGKSRSNSGMEVRRHAATANTSMRVSLHVPLLSGPHLHHLLCSLTTMLGGQRSRCLFCGGPLPACMYNFCCNFCCNECQCCWHRERGTAPNGWYKPAFRRELAEKKQALDDHERKVKGAR